MEGMFHSEKICPYCNQLISQELYNDHILCHELEQQKSTEVHSESDEDKSDSEEEEDFRNDEI